ncbi:hypothetical protein OUZ56_031437 [Daphnia magna]|uniref:Uncharacterized protein n=1 Tax=Daphnia magna TaxID=35525 RepID=A0ABQ9ZUQ6_9CRUS|nr:hypothetical protein OUZ56_031437 [Daphnia magna]
MESLFRIGRTLLDSNALDNFIKLHIKPSGSWPAALESSKALSMRNRIIFCAHQKKLTHPFTLMTNMAVQTGLGSKGWASYR